MGKWVKRERKYRATGVALKDSFEILYCGNGPIAPRSKEKEMEEGIIGRKEKGRDGDKRKSKVR